MHILSGLLRRLLGGWLSTKDIISERGIQWLIGIVIYATSIYIKINWFNGYNTWLYNVLPLWLFIILGAVSVVLCLTAGHFPGFMCGTEDINYIKEQISNGREIKFEKIVNWIAEKRNFMQYDKEWCFWQLFFCKTYACILPSLFFGYHFLLLGILVTFGYNAMFWINPKPIKNVLTSPTNYGEFIQGWYIISFLFI